MLRPVLCSALILFIASSCAPKPGQGAVSGDATADDAPQFEIALPYRAVGNEPGWHLTITASDMTLVYAYGEKTATVSTATVDDQSGSVRYSGKNDTQALTATITAELCRDVMSGMPFPHRAVVTINDATLNGCGGMPMSLLTGDEWIVEDLDGKGVIDFAQTTMTFSNDGNIFGSGACNRYNASVELTGEGLSVGPIASTKKMCPPAVMNQEALFLETLGSVTRFDIREDGALVLFDANDRTILARR